MTYYASYEQENALLSRKAAEEGIVLLKNEGHVLPLKAAGKLALCGVGAVRTVRGGIGSGDPFNCGNDPSIVHIDQSERFHVNIMPALIEAGWYVVNEAEMNHLADEYDVHKENFRGSMMDTFVSPEKRLEEAAVKSWAAETDTVIMVISRTAGEGADRSLLKQVEYDGKTITVGDYLLCAEEKHNIHILRRYFTHVIVVLNVGGIIDTAELQCADAIVLLGQGGQESGAACVRVLNGEVNPSGKLTDTWAYKYEDYPASASFAFNGGNAMEQKYTEGIYIGYRYFYSFGIPFVYPFGFGMSYTEFSGRFIDAVIEHDVITVRAEVSNIGNVSGAEVLQLYVSKPETVMEMPERELIAFAKTAVLSPGKCEILEMTISLSSLSAYDETNNETVVSAGKYLFRLGNSSLNAEPVFVVKLPETLVLSRHHICLSLKEELEEIHHPAYLPVSEEGLPVLTCEITSWNTVDYNELYADPAVPPKHECVPEGVRFTYEDVMSGHATAEQLVSQFTNMELAVFVCGIGHGSEGLDPVVGENARSVPGAAGETTHTLAETYGIPWLIFADGPAGLRVRQDYVMEDGSVIHNHSTAWPVGTVLAQTFDRELVKEVGKGFAKELQAIDVDFILGPGMNIHRDPLCGRNFEYFSEDPLLTGEITAGMIQGIQHNERSGGCIKHLVANNQETYRNRMNSILGQRTLRDIYLKGFEIAVKKSHPYSLMTCYNRVNDEFAPESHELCTDIARTEWGFEGLIVNDWNGGVHHSQFMIAGNDVIMPGGYSKVKNVLMGMERVEPEFAENGMVSMTRYSLTTMAHDNHWNSFYPSPDGDVFIPVKLGKGYRAEVVNGEILVNGEKLWITAKDRILFMGKPDGEVFPFEDAVTEDVCMVSDDGTQITYRGKYRELPEGYRYYVENCAAHIIRTMAAMHKTWNSKNE